MTQEDKELLIKDLCARLPYGVIVDTPKGKGHVCDINLTIFDTEIGVNINPIVRDTFSINDVKPYLFPLSSMTEEQKCEFMDTCTFLRDSAFGWTDESFDWCNKNHYDYRGLMGLAIDATDKNIY